MSTHPRRGRLRVLATCMATMAVLTACTGSDDPDVATPGSTSSGSVTSATPEGPTADELSAEVLGAAEEITGADALGSVTAPVLASGGTSGELTVEVIRLRRVEDGVHLQMLWSSPGEPLSVQPPHISRRPHSNNFISELYLDDTAGQTRYLPIRFDDNRNACACPYSPIEVSDAPQLVDAVYAIPPEVTTVTFRAGDTEIEIPDLPIS